MHELEFKDWLYDEGFLRDLAKKASGKITMLALGGALALGIGADRYFKTPAAPMPQVQIDPSRTAIRIPKGGFEFRIQGYGKVESGQIRINRIRTRGLSDYALQASLASLGGTEMIQNKIAEKLNAQSDRGYGHKSVPPGKEVDRDNEQKLGGQKVTVVLEDAPIYAGTPFDPIFVTGSIDLDLGEGSWIAPAK